MQSPPPCMACGVCCTGDSTRHAAVTGDDWSRIDELPEPPAAGASLARVAMGTDDAAHWVAWTENHAFMRMADGRCAALDVEGGQFRCVIYSRRPEVCRALERSSPACEAEIARKGESVRLRLVLWKG